VDSGADALALLAQALLALRSTSELGAACAIAGSCAVEALDASEYRLLRVDARSGALHLLEESGVETPYLAERGGPIEAVLRTEAAAFDDGGSGPNAPREALLWLDPPLGLATVPLFAGSTLFGFLIVSFSAMRDFAAVDRLFLQALADGLALAVERAEQRAAIDEGRRRLAELERRLDTDEQSSSSLMGIVAHEIRTPLTAIKAYAETLLDTLSNPHTPRERFLGIINDECDRLTRLITDILDLSRLEAGQRPLRLARVDLGQLAHEISEGLEPTSRPRQIKLEIDSEDQLVVEADADLLRRLLLNLLVNAVKFSPVGGTVHLRARTSHDEWHCEVEDEGPGIPAEDMPRVFERFFRARQPGEQQVEGTGLGLAIARGIAELHGGRHLRLGSLALHSWLSYYTPSQRNVRFVIDYLTPPTR
jgi:signal transduction histidine kinase